MKPNKKTRRASPMTERLEARVSHEQKRFLQRAAAIQGVTLTDFLIGSAQSVARKTIAEHEVIKLTTEESRRFFKALMHPPAPTRALLRAAERYRKMVDSR